MFFRKYKINIVPLHFSIFNIEYGNSQRGRNIWRTCGLDSACKIGDIFFIYLCLYLHFCRAFARIRVRFRRKRVNRRSFHILRRASTKSTCPEVRFEIRISQPIFRGKIARTGRRCRKNGSLNFSTKTRTKFHRNFP